VRGEDADVGEDRFRGRDLVSDAEHVEQGKDLALEDLQRSLELPGLREVVDDPERIRNDRRHNHHDAVDAGCEIAKEDRIVTGEDLESSSLQRRNLREVVICQLDGAQVLELLRPGRDPLRFDLRLRGNRVVVEDQVDLERRVQRGEVGEQSGRRVLEVRGSCAEHR
jgi:hypothetical protein